MCVPHLLSNLKAVITLQEGVKVVVSAQLPVTATCSRNAQIVTKFRVAAMNNSSLTGNAGTVKTHLESNNWVDGNTLANVSARRIRLAAKLGRESDGQSEIEEHRVLHETGLHTARKLLTLPTALTLLRIAAIPALLAVFYNTSWWSTAAGATIFVVASLTDWLDGYLARKMKTSSAFGAFLDPVADKLMVATTLVLLCTRPLSMEWASRFPWLVPLPSIAIIGREITMSAVREWAASQGGDVHKAVAVNNIGKWKTAFQMVALTLLLCSHNGRFDWVSTAGIGLLYIAAVLACWSLAVYLKAIWGSFTK